MAASRATSWRRRTHSRPAAARGPRPQGRTRTRAPRPAATAPTRAGTRPACRRSARPARAAPARARGA
eukprot:2193639-Prymnesium_polylepis.1